MNETRILTADEFAREKWINPRRVKELARAGLVPEARRDGATWLIPARVQIPGRLIEGHEEQPPDLEPLNNANRRALGLQPLAIIKPRPRVPGDDGE